MTQNVWFIAAIWMALALSASLISIWAGISVALVEILVGIVAGDFLGIHATTDWINFLALLGSGDALDEMMQVAASASNGTIPDELPKPAGMPMLDVNEISKKIVIEKPAMLLLFGKGIAASRVRRKLESEYDRALLDFLSLYANRLRR